MMVTREKRRRKLLEKLKIRRREERASRLCSRKCIVEKKRCTRTRADEKSNFPNTTEKKKLPNSFPDSPLLQFSTREKYETIIMPKPPSVPATEQARKKLTVAQLKKILPSLNLPVDGLKADLLARLETHLKSENENGGKKTTASAEETTGGKKRGRSKSPAAEEGAKVAEKKNKKNEIASEDEPTAKGTPTDAATESGGQKDDSEKTEGTKATKVDDAKIRDDANEKKANDKKKEKTTSLPLTQIGAYERLRARRLEICYENFPADADEALARRVFETYGDVQEILCSGSEGVVRFQTQEAAESALAALDNGSYVMDGCEKGVKVRWAAWEENLKSKATEAELDLRKFVEEECDEFTRSSNQVWIGASSKLASDELVKAWLERFGEVESFKPFRKEKHFSFLATYAKEEDAKLCRNSLNEKQPPGSLVYHAPLRVEFTIIDEKTRISLEKMAQKVINPQQQQGPLGGKAPNAPAVKKTESPAKNREKTELKRPDSREVVPPGMVIEPPSSSEPTTPDVIARYLRSVYPNANKLPKRGEFSPPNAYNHGQPSEKLYVSSIPACYDKNAILPMFEAVGDVVDVHILFDRHTRKHKGSGFVTFRTFEDAERTIALLDQKYILDNRDPNLPTNKPIYFKFAKGNQQQQMFQQGAPHQGYQQHGGGVGGQSMQSMAMQNQQQYMQMQQMQQVQQQQYWQMMAQQQQQQFQHLQPGQQFMPPQHFPPPQ